MKLAKNYLSVGFAALAIAAAAPASATEFKFERENAGLELGLSTLGNYVAPTYKLNERVGLRTPVHFGSYEGEDDYEGNPLSYDLDLTSSAVMVDYHPFEGGLRLSAGLGFGGYEAGAAVTDPELGDNTFTGTYDFRLEQKSNVAPILSMGYVQPLGERIALVGEVGGKLTTYKVGTNLDAISDPAVRADMETEIAAINDDLGEVKVTPFLSMGIKFRF